MKKTFVYRISSFAASICALCLFGLIGTSEGAIIYVKAGSSGDGSSWDTASGDLVSALESASSGDEVWVAAGSYRPDAVSPDVYFTLKDGVGLYGGFEGDETNRGDRDPAVNETILSGDNFSYHVVYSGVGVTSSTVLDGFTITGGKASGDHDLYQDAGGGMFNKASSPTVTNCTFLLNKATNGGGMFNCWGSFPTVDNCTFSLNNATDGGGMLNDSSVPTVTNCTFSLNNATSGGGMLNNESHSRVTNCTFSGNNATDGGGIFNRKGSPNVSNCTFSENIAQNGGGMLNIESSSKVTNCTFSKNNATIHGDGICNKGSSPTVTNCILWGIDSPSDQIVDQGGSTNATYSVVDTSLFGDPSNVSADPRLGPLFYNGGPTMTCALLAGSSALNSGTSVGAPVKDQRGISRPQGISFDMGAYEVESTPVSPPAPTPTPTPTPEPQPEPTPTPTPEPQPEPTPDPIPVQPSLTPILSSDVILPRSGRTTMAVPMIVTISGDATEQEKTDQLMEALRRTMVPETLIENLTRLLAIDGTGQVYLTDEAMGRLLMSLSTDMDITAGSSCLPLPFFRASILARADDNGSTEPTTAVVFFQVPECFSDKSSDLLQIVKVFSSDMVLAYDRVYDLSDLTDGRFVVLDTETTSAGPEVKGALSRDEMISNRCVVAIALSDGGSFDLDGRNNGSVIDPAFMIEGVRKESQKPTVSSGSGGCLIGPVHGLSVALIVPLLLLYCR